MREGKTQIGKWKTQPQGALNQCLSKQALSVSLRRHLSLLDTTSASLSHLALSDPHLFLYPLFLFLLFYMHCVN